jgi:3,4-dihydroxy 2-butanone 4-phosphate synthase / GTP cyclohydrolase II
MVTVAELIRYRMQNERYVERVAEGVLPTAHGEFRTIAYESAVEGGQSHIALVKGDLEAAAASGEGVLVRMQTHCLAGSVFGSTLCDCQPTIEASLAAIAAAGSGALIYLHHTQRGFGIEAGTPPARMVFHRSGADGRERTGDPEQRILRQVGLGGQILWDLGIKRIRLLTNHLTHVPALHGFGLEIAECVPLPRHEPGRGLGDSDGEGHGRG